MNEAMVCYFWGTITTFSKQILIVLQLGTFLIYKQVEQTVELNADSKCLNCVSRKVIEMIIGKG